MKFLPHIQQYNLLFVIVVFVDVAVNVSICACMAFIVMVSCANFAMTAELELVRTALDCTSPSS